MTTNKLTSTIKRLQFLVIRLKASNGEGSRCRDWANEFDRLKAAILNDNLDWGLIAKSIGCQFDTNGGDLLA